MTEAHPAQSTGGASCDDEGATVIPDAGHYLLAVNPEAVGDLIEQHAGAGTR
jgi:hypothetical protein